MAIAAPPAAEQPPRAPSAAVSVRVEAEIDYAETAALAADAFAAEAGRFTPEGLRWLYEDAFGDGTTVLAAYADGRKVGHLALLHQRVVVGGRSEPAVALVDVFVVEAFRSLVTLVGLYRGAETACRERGIHLILSMPNAMAAEVNARILQLREVARLDIRLGVAGLPVPGVRIASHRLAELEPGRVRHLVAPFCGGTRTGLDWTAERLAARLTRPGAGYALHVGERLLAVSAPRRTRGAPHTLLCALLPRPGATVRRRDIAAVTAAACRAQRRPLFAYAGINEAVPLPGAPLPARLRPSPMALQMRDLRHGALPFAMGRFETLDFDLA